MLRSLSFSVALAILAFASQTVVGSIVYNSATFSNFNVITNDATQFSASADILQGGVNAGTIVATQLYGGGTNPFNSGTLWGAGNDFRIGAFSTQTSEVNETADGLWSISVTPNANWSVDGISLFSTGSVISNPTFGNLSSNGVATVHDDNQGTTTELFSNYNDGDAFLNGDDLIFNPGDLPTGIISDDHTRLWSYDSAGGTDLTFRYEAGPVANISNEAFAVDLELTLALIPEPSSLGLMMAASLGLLARRRRN